MKDDKQESAQRDQGRYDKRLVGELTLWSANHCCKFCEGRGALLCETASAVEALRQIFAKDK